MTRTLLCCALAIGCGSVREPVRARPAPRPRAEEPAVEGIARCSEGGRVEALGAPLSDDLSGLVIDGQLLWTHTDARRRRPMIFAMDVAAPAEAARTLHISDAVVDPEDLARLDGVTYLADTGDNAGPARCFRLARDGDACALAEVLPIEEEDACLAVEDALWVRRTIATDRAPYRIHALRVDGASIDPIARLEWSRYPSEQCLDPQCRLEESAFAGHFDAEAIFLRRERGADGTVGTSLYVVTKAPFPLSALVAIQRGQRCRFEGERRALVFRIAGVDALRGRVNVEDRMEQVAVLELDAPDALAVQVTGASLAENDLVLLTRSRTLRWHVPADVARMDQRFFDAHRPCIAASPELAQGPKLEGIALGPLGADGERGWYAVSEEGDFAQEGAEALFRIRERWNYDGAVFVRGDANGDGSIDDADAALLRAGGAIACMDAADANDDGRVDARDSDALAGLQAGACARDETPDELTCASYPATACGL